MSALNPRERLNAAAEALGLAEHLAPDYGQAAWTDVLTKIIAALAERARETQEALKRRPQPVRKRRVAKRRVAKPRRVKLEESE
jgi:hypothetical protein